MSAPDDALDPIVERAPDRETWVGVKQGDQEDRDFDMAELQRLRDLRSTIEWLADRWDDREFSVDISRGIVVDTLRDALKRAAA